MYPVAAARWCGRLYLVASLLSGLYACAPKPRTLGSPQRGRPQGAVLILLDTVRADHLSCYGYERPTSPALAELARHGALFENAVTAAPWTLPSVWAMLAGRLVDHAVTADNKLGLSVVESIRRAGYATAAVTEGGFVSRRFGFNLGFNEYIEQEGDVQLLDEPDTGEPPTGGIENTFAHAREWIAKHRDERFFLLIHSYEAHAPHDRKTFTAGMPVARFGDVFTFDTAAQLQSGKISLDDADLNYLKALYDGGIRTADDQVGAFLDFLQTIGLRDRTLVVVTSDHGEELGDHYPQFSGDHGHSLNDELLLVPLVLHNPLEQYRVQRVQPQVRTIDILPTIADILGAPIDYPTDGASLVPMLRGEEREGRLAYGGHTEYGPEQVFLRHMGYKQIEVTAFPGKDRRPVLPSPPLVQLYGLTRDPHEKTNLADSEPHVVHEMEHVLASVLAPRPDREITPPLDQVDAALHERLRSLGYVN